MGRSLKAAAAFGPELHQPDSSDTYLIHRKL
jgi:hypothetical protein